MIGIYPSFYPHGMGKKDSQWVERRVYANVGGRVGKHLLGHYKGATTIHTTDIWQLGTTHQSNQLIDQGIGVHAGMGLSIDYPGRAPPSQCLRHSYPGPHNIKY